MNPCGTRMGYLCFSWTGAMQCPILAKRTEHFCTWKSSNDVTTGHFLKNTQTVKEHPQVRINNLNFRKRTHFLLLSVHVTEPVYLKVSSNWVLSFSALFGTSLCPQSNVPDTTSLPLQIRAQMSRFSEY